MASKLSRTDIADIIQSYEAGETKSQIAVRYNIDHSTVIYHISKHERMGSSSEIYAVVQIPKRPCIHPSMKCLVCGRPQDELRREERARIRELEAALRNAKNRLREHGLPVE